MLVKYRYITYPLLFDGTHTSYYVGINRYKLIYSSRAKSWTCQTFYPSKVENGLHIHLSLNIAKSGALPSK